MIFLSISQVKSGQKYFTTGTYMFPFFNLSYGYVLYVLYNLYISHVYLWQHRYVRLLLFIRIMVQ